MKCPHCLTSFHSSPAGTALGEDVSSKWIVIQEKCPACNRLIISLTEYYKRYPTAQGQSGYEAHRQFLCYPRVPSRAPIPQEVPGPYVDDYKEACLTLTESPKASAALSRRCLQHILREKAGVKHGNLANEIQQALDSGLPSYISEALDAVRNIGNFAAHPIKSESSGEIIDVEPGEAEWNLDVLESLF